LSSPQGPACEGCVCRTTHAVATVPSQNVLYTFWGMDLESWGQQGENDPMVMLPWREVAMGTCGGRRAVGCHPSGAASLDGALSFPTVEKTPLLL
jgi:hypothetical protein